MKLIAAALGATLFMGASAQAQTVYNTSLNQTLPITTTNASGTRTTNAGTQESGSTTVGGPWVQTDVGGGATVGITTDYARNGNGSAYFSTTNTASKADLFNYVAGYTTPVALSTLSDVSFDFYRSSSSTTSSNYAPVLRLDLKLDNTTYAGSLVLENFYQHQAASPVDSWTTVSASLSDGIFWATNSAIGPTNASANGGQKTLQDWINSNPGHTIGVYGVEVGVGSGWDGTFSGGVDDVKLSFNNGPQVSSNFEVAGAVSAAPEPGTWALMLGGVGIMGAMLRVVAARCREDEMAAL